MDQEKLIRALTARADIDARAFREKNPDDVPTELWIENSYTAALPLAKDEAGLDPGDGPHPTLFDAYRRAIRDRVGERSDKREDGATLEQQPTPGLR
jgi:hypothetical protein